MQLFITLYLFGNKIHRKIVKWFFGNSDFTLLISEGFWLALLSKKTIAAIDDYHYRKSEKYYSDQYNSSGLLDWESQMIDAYFTRCRTLMVLASGGGREVYALLKKDFAVDGFECNTRLVETSNQFFTNSGLRANIEYAAPNHCPDNNKIYDGIILGWGAYNHVQGKNNRIQLLKEINSHMMVGSPFLISYWYAYEKMEKYCRKLTKTNRFFCKIFRTQPIEKGNRLTPFAGHHFTSQEAGEELSLTGFEVVYQASHPYGHMVAQKIRDASLQD